MWWPLALVSVRSSIRYHVIPGALSRDVLAEAAESRQNDDTDSAVWWRLRSVS
ncbi:MAG: hypothetical protein WAX14_06320 [Rhodococcus sp. (in: high G+C Gram-positive bacteria)]|uniref:hypothetical protein n=1 Tax=Rhodococcus sp. TaxID=1831 RepID=UPI003BB4FF9F